MELKPQAILTVTGAGRAVAALAALAQETRLAVFRLLVEHAREGLTPGADGFADFDVAPDSV